MDEDEGDTDSDCAVMLVVCPGARSYHWGGWLAMSAVNVPTKTMQNTTMTPTLRAAQFFSRLASWFRASRAKRGVVMAAIAKCGSGE